MSIIAIIPARMSSSRFPGKPLKPILGLSMVEHVRRRVSLCKIINEVIVATCDIEIFDEVERFGGKVIMTSSCHGSCIDRVAEAASELKADIIINVQGDMPLVNPDSLEELVKPLLQDKNIHYTDMMAPITDISEINKANVVKVVVSLSGRAVYYSREAIPSKKKESTTENVYFKQLGINAFRKESLERFSNLNKSPLEITESIDMLRLLENDFNVMMVITTSPSLGVDTPDDLILAQDMMKDDTLLSTYIGGVQ